MADGLHVLARPDEYHIHNDCTRTIFFFIFSYLQNIRVHNRPATAGKRCIIGIRNQKISREKRENNILTDFFSFFFNLNSFDFFCQEISYRHTAADSFFSFPFRDKMAGAKTLCRLELELWNFPNLKEMTAGERVEVSLCRAPIDLAFRDCG